MPNNMLDQAYRNYTLSLFATNISIEGVTAIDQQLRQYFADRGMSVQSETKH